MKKYCIQKIKVPRSLRFPNGYGWELRDNDLKRILGIWTTKKEAKENISQLKDNG